MALTRGEIIDRPALVECIKQQASALLRVNEHSPRLASIFATQHRWLMAHIGLSLYFRGLSEGRRDGLGTARFIEDVALHGAASRNTAASFIAEMVKYGVLEQRPHPTDRRKHLLEPSPHTLEALGTWMDIHLRTLDGLDGGDRLERYRREEQGAARLQPRIADGLLRSPTIREPSPEFSHFMWLNSGFLIAERLIAMMQDEADRERIGTAIASVTEMASGLGLSRSHAARKLREAEAQGAIGWTGERGRSPMWVSRAFVRHYMNVQAAKLEIIDAAFEASFPGKGTAA